MFQQSAAEYRATVVQIFRTAGSRIDGLVSQPDASALDDQVESAGKPPAIIVDVDETVLTPRPGR